jgi:hypothetical protein
MKKGFQGLLQSIGKTLVGQPINSSQAGGKGQLGAPMAGGIFSGIINQYSPSKWRSTDDMFQQLDKTLNSNVDSRNEVLKSQGFPYPEPGIPGFHEANNKRRGIVPSDGVQGIQGQSPFDRLTQPSPTPVPFQKTQEFNPVPQSLDQSVSDFLENTAFPVTRRYGIPDPITAGVFAAEGRLSGLGASRNNFYNINAHDSNPDRAFGYETPEDGVEAFAKFITGQFEHYPSEEHRQRFLNAFQQNQNDPVAMIEAIGQAGYAGNPSTWVQRKIEQDGVRPNVNSWAEFVRANPEWRYTYSQ